MRNFREYDIWVDGRKLVNRIYDLTDGFPDKEKFGLTSQVNRAAVSIILNIAEGASRKSEKDFRRFLEFSLGSAFEVETVILISSDRQMIHASQAEKLIIEVQSLQRRIQGFINRLQG